MVYIERTLDVGLCLEILMNKDIFEAISEDGATYQNLKVDVLNEYWLAILTDKEIIGCLQLKPKYKNCYHAHIHILPEHRKEHSVSAGEQINNWIGSELKGSVIYVETPVICQNVIRYLERFKFKHVGILEKAYNKNEQQHDIVIMSKGF